MVEVDNVTRFYGELEAVSGVTFKAGKGEILGLLGPNAAGKTTLMRIITGYLPATSGSVRVAGHDVFDSPMEVKKRVGYLPENPPLYMDMTVAGYLQFAAELKGVPRSERRGRIEKVMSMVSIDHIAGRLIENISKGYRQRVGLAQALVHNPDVLILDEPTVGLDPKQIIEIRELIRQLGKEHTIILSSHILPEVSATCDRVVILNRGKVAAIDTQDGLSKRFTGSGARLIVEFDPPPENAVATLSGIDGVTAAAPAGPETAPGSFLLDIEQGKDPRASVFRSAVENGWTLVGLSRETLSLEDVFLQLTQDEAAENGTGEEADND